MTPDVRRALVGVAVLGVALVGLAAVWWWSGQRPAHLVVDATPPTARIQVGEHKAVGHLELQLPAGPTRVQVQAAGHRGSTTELTLAPGDELHLRPRLMPLNGTAP